MRGARSDPQRSSKEHAPPPGGISTATKLLVFASSVMLIASVATLYSPSPSQTKVVTQSSPPPTLRGESVREDGPSQPAPATHPAPQAGTGLTSPGSKLCRAGKTLDEIGIAKGTDKRSTFHGFLHHYDRLFARDLCARDTVKILELGVFHGASIATWIDYYGAGEFYGVDHLDKAKARAAINKAKQDNPDAKVEVIIIDIDAKMADLESKLQALGPFDVILDDAKHTFDQQFKLIKHLLKFVKPGGWFVCEDLHTSLRGEMNFYGGNDYERPLDLFNGLQNPEGGVFKPNSMFSSADFEAARALAEEVVVYYHRTAKVIEFEGITYQPFTSVTGAIRVRQS